MQFVIAAPVELVDALAELVEPLAEVERSWLERSRAAAWARPGVERRDALAAVDDQLLLLRERGELLGTQGAVVAHHLRAILREEGWDVRTWRAVPAGVKRLPGRPLGRGERQLADGDRGGPARLVVMLPDDLGDLVRRIAYRVSRPAVVKLAGKVARAERERLRGEVLTTGDLIRAAALRALGREFYFYSPQRPASS
ncbi:hypothetical protein AB0M43_38290 [Longispora sp. NPDC051575]|uniref:hypothetical protein n=1 Tax=Longispora sp. NPDC051575 TaxID=3154943 RepID=UPI0034221CB1